MSARRKNGDIIAMIVSIIIAIFLASALIYGSEYRRRKDLEELHEKVLKAAELNTVTEKKMPAAAAAASAAAASAAAAADLKLQSANPGPKVEKSTNEDVNSFANMIRAMPSDPNTPLLAPDYDDDSNGSSEQKSEKSEKGVKENVVKNENTTNPPKPISNPSKSSENIVPFQPQSEPNPVFNVKDEIESIRRQVADKIKSEAKAPLERPKLKPPPRKGNIIFDPVPGLFPKTFVDRFFKKRRVRVIMYGPKNSKREFVMEGGGGGDKGDGKLAEKLINPLAENTPVVA